MNPQEMHYVASTVTLAHKEEIARLARTWEHEHHGPRRYKLLVENDDYSVWLFGWRPGEETTDHHIDSTPIHGHGESSVLVTYLKGEVDNDDYGTALMPLRLGQDFAYEMRTQTLHAGERLYVPKYGIHDMRCDNKEGRGFALTLHIYAPRLVSMSYFDVSAVGRLRFVDTWHEDAKPAQGRPPTDPALVPSAW